MALVKSMSSGHIQSEWSALVDRDIDQILKARCASSPDSVFLSTFSETLTFSGFDALVDEFGKSLGSQGIASGSRVAVCMSHTTDHIAAIFALIRLAAVIIPVNPGAKGELLEFTHNDANPDYYLHESEISIDFEHHVTRFTSIKRQTVLPLRASRVRCTPVSPENRTNPSQTRSAGSAPGDLALILYTSGTTGLPKSVPVTNGMLKASAIGCRALSGVEHGDVLHFWDPLYHIFGIETAIMAIISGSTLAVVERFSASRFWQECVEFGVTHIHYVGSILPILLKTEPSDSEEKHHVRIAWGGGCPESIWSDFETRFGVRIREGYGLTETSSFCLVNPGDVFGSVGRPLDYFDVCILDREFNECADAEKGQLAVKPRFPHVMFTGYLNRDDATRSSFHGEWFLTGDFGYRDKAGDFYFLGREKNMIRRKGENVSADFIERSLAQYEGVLECAVIPVESDVGEDDIKVFLRVEDRNRFDCDMFWDWCTLHISSYMIPDYLEIVAAFEKTPTQRIIKDRLNSEVSNCFVRKTERGS